MKGWRILWLICGLVLLAFWGGAQGQEKYPSRLIELVVPMAPGGSADVFARLYSDDLARMLMVPITVVNRAGGSGIQGSTYVAKAKKDGYTILQASTGHLVIMPLITGEAKYDALKDFVPLAHAYSVPTVFVVKSDSPFKTLQELVEYARKNPGKLKNGAGGLGTISDFNLMVLCSRNKIKITTIPFKSGGESTPALLGGHVDMSTNTIITLAPQIKAGKLRGLAITSKTRNPEFPDIPTTAEAGYPYVNIGLWAGLFAPAGVPQQVLDVLVPSLEKVFKNPDVVDRATKAGFIMDYKNPEEFRKLMESDIPVVEKSTRDLGLSKK